MRIVRPILIASFFFQVRFFAVTHTHRKKWLFSQIGNEVTGKGEMNCCIANVLEQYLHTTAYNYCIHYRI